MIATNSTFETVMPVSWSVRVLRKLQATRQAARPCTPEQQGADMPAATNVQATTTRNIMAEGCI